MISIHEIPYSSSIGETDNIFGYNVVLEDDYKLQGTEKNDLIVARSNQKPIQNPDIPKKTWDAKEKLEFYDKLINPENLPTHKLIGGSGEDIFLIDFDLNTSNGLMKKHSISDGTIQWKGVAGNNDFYHQHWVGNVGKINIKDFEAGDTLMIRGHTINIKQLPSKEGFTRLGIYSDQGNDGLRGFGAHDFDVLGMIRIAGDFFNFEKIEIENHSYNGIKDLI